MKEGRVDCIKEGGLYEGREEERKEGGKKKERRKERRKEQNKERRNERTKEGRGEQWNKGATFFFCFLALKFLRLRAFFALDSACEGTGKPFLCKKEKWVRGGGRKGGRKE